MVTIQISDTKKIGQHHDLIAIPKSAYEKFLAWEKNYGSIREFIPTASEKRALARARKNFSKGAYSSFNTLRHELDSHR
ncbi:MAG: hypothetical protein A3D65_03775 [Candidatus Lloydbacteria bacterium RIFCSPHIGHO2_02_FULL_50_13]|uniref:Uncharacterized protein n=1 Tax=Candidatus Lloydbacteria bacterium RIFCSPHIGHO2_02_FULL_50_13 TaxID=1798661 RepID=A0A1G2D1V2_9BACT|nr:MAG: hypothetical protein A3D65_03775 [Candidatus Lloydbacteria bacterium RIFCSPHIGHO2_02_FULL_50_13]